MKQFYVYIHKKPDGTPFYVGKGNARRVATLHRDNKHHTNIVAKYGAENIIIEVTQCISEEQAFELEKIYIKQLKEDGYCLCNRTNGGEGISGYKFDPDLVQKLAEINRLKIRTEEFKQRVGEQWRGRKRGPPSEEHRQRNSDAKKGNTFRRGSRHTPESIERMKIAQRKWREDKGIYKTKKT